jgi:adenosylcobinamide kinase/adenosylcobinamide-phosphate guanylyltransferase
MGKHLTLILGGARSGKSYYAQRLAEESQGEVLFVATATAGDDEMKMRIAAHRASRPAGWRTLEVPLQVGRAVSELAHPGVVLIDCMTLLASNVLFSLPEAVDEKDYQAALDVETTALLDAYQKSPAEWIIISNEVGLGLVPPYPLGRIYRDGLGRINQRLAQAADSVLFLVAGLPMRVKG